MLIDTLKTFERLKDRGYSEEQARGLIETITSVEEQVATKEDINLLREELTGRIDKLDGRMNALDESLTGRMNALDESLTGRMNALDESLTGRMNALEEKMTGRMNALEEKMTGRMNFLEDRVIRNVYGVVIGVGALVIAAVAIL